MGSYPYVLLLISMFLNLIVVINTLNKPNAAIPVSFAGVSIVIQGIAMRMIAIHSV